ncbi:hypothetical protein FI667_g7596, partial [Globisporangium splendens]
MELSHGIYNFKDVWSYYKRLGWKTKAGGELGYDHYYIKPGKSVKRDVEGEDFFYGEAALVQYGMSELIFGEVPPPPPPPPPQRPLDPQKAWRTTYSKESASDFTGTSDYDDDDDSSGSRRVHGKPQPTHRNGARISTKQSSKKRTGGSNALDAISIASGSGSDKPSTASTVESSDDDENDADFHVGDDENEEEEEVEFEDSVDDDEEEEEESDSSSDDSDDVVFVNSGYLASKLKGNFKAQKKTRPLLRTHKKKRKNIFESSESVKLETKVGKRAKKMKTTTKGASLAASVKSEHRGVKYEHKVYAPASSQPISPAASSPGKSKRKPATPRRVPTENASSAQAPTVSTQMDSTNAPAQTSVPSLVVPPPVADAAPAPTSQTHSFMSIRTPPPSAEPLNKGRDVTPSMQGSQLPNDFGEGEPTSSSGDFYDNHSSFEPEPLVFEEPRCEPPENISAHFENKPSEHETKLHSAPPAPQATPHQPPPPTAAIPEIRTDVPAPPAPPVAEASNGATPPQLHLQLDEVLFPSQPEELFRIKITSTDTPKQTRIWIENIETREQRECIFTDIRQLNGKTSQEISIPERAIFEALLRSLQALRNASRGSSMEPEREKFSTEEPGKVDLLRDESDAVCLQLMFPCYEFWHLKHRFMMKLVSAKTRLNSLVRELDETKKELSTTQQEMEAYKSKNALLETECDQLRSLVRVYQEKEHAQKKLAELHHHHQQQMLREFSTHDTKLAPPVQQPAQASYPKRSLPARKGDSRSFSARSGWLVSSSASMALQVSDDKCISWESIHEVADRYFHIVNNANQVVRVLQTGTYQMNLNVTHENSLGLVVHVTNGGTMENSGAIRTLDPTLVQFYDNKQRVSRLDRVVELNANDQVSVHLAELGTPRDRVCWLQHFVPQPNLLFITFLDHELVYKDAR